MISMFTRVRSEPLGDRRLAVLTKELVKRLGRSAINRHEAMRLEAFTLLRDRLGPLDAFFRLDSVMSSRPIGVERSNREPYLDEIRRHNPTKSKMNLYILGTEAVSPGYKPEAIDFRLSFGWQKSRTVGNYSHCTFEVGGASPGAVDLGYRRDLFLRIIDLIGLSGSIAVEWDGNDLRVSAARGWTATPIIPQLGGANPRGISVAGFQSVDAALDAGERIIERVLRRVDACDFSSYAEKGDYNALIRPLNSIAKDWKCAVNGALSEAAGSVLAGAPIEAAPDRVPAFWWGEADSIAPRAPWYTYSGELVATEEGYCLELTTDRNDPERLMNYASLMDGLRFHLLDEARS